MKWKKHQEPTKPDPFSELRHVLLDDPGTPYELEDLEPPKHLGDAQAVADWVVESLSSLPDGTPVAGSFVATATDGGGILVKASTNTRTE